MTDEVDNQVRRWVGEGVRKYYVKITPPLNFLLLGNNENNHSVMTSCTTWINFNRNCRFPNNATWLLLKVGEGRRTGEKILRSYRLPLTKERVNFHTGQQLITRVCEVQKKSVGRSR